MLQKAGARIDSDDLWVAAHARSLGVPLVSSNLREFEHMPGPKLESRV